MIAVLFALVLVAETAPEPMAELPAELITDPVWKLSPQGQDLARYISGAPRQGGSATVQCTISDKGWLTRCHIISETAPRESWGKATLAVARQYRAEPLSQGGQPTVGKLYRLTLHWNLPPSR